MGCGKMSDINIQSLIDILNNIDSLIGDTPVSEQLSIALNRMASKSHAHDEYVSRDEYEVLKSQIEHLSSLVGDVAVSEQINMAISKN